MRKKRLSATFAVTIGMAAAGVGAAATPQEGSGSRGELVRLGERSWAWVSATDDSSNGALFVGERAALAVDGGLTPAISRAFLAAAARVSDRPVERLVVTHWHPDHSLGAVCLPGRGFRLVAHPATRDAIAERIPGLLAGVAGGREGEERSELLACRPQPPDEVVADRRTYDLGALDVEVFHPGPAHTQGDLVVWSPQEGVLATGDLFLRDSCPAMGEGSVVHWVEALDALLALEPRRVVPGHFEPGAAVDLARFRDYLAALVGRVREELAKGARPEDVPGAVAFPDFAGFRQYPKYQATFEDNAAVVVRELSGGTAAP